MTRQRNALKAGIFMIASLILTLAVIAAIRDLSDVAGTKVERKVTFKLEDDLGGLRVGDDVRIGGFKVGEVRGITIEQAGQGPAGSEAGQAAAATSPAGSSTAQEFRIVVRYAIPEQYVIRKGARLAIQGTVTGQSWLNFESLGAGDEVAELEGRPGVMANILASLNQVGTRVNSIATKVDTETIPTVNQALTSVRDQTVPEVNKTVVAYRTTAESGTALVNDLRAQVKPAMDKYNQVTDSTTGLMNEVRDVVGDTKTDIRGTMANVHAATGSIKEKLPGILDRVQGVVQKVDTAVTSANVALEDIQKIAVNTRDTTAAARSVIVGNKSKLDGMIASLKATGDNLKYASAEIRRSPWRLLYKPGAGEMANLNLFDSARQFAEGANDLNDAAQALRDALQDKQADPERLKQLMERVDTTFAKFNEVEQKLWEEVRR